MSFVDTNVLVYASAAASPQHLQARSALDRLCAEGPVAVSRQILREFLSVTTRPQPWAQAASMSDATRAVNDFARRFILLPDGPAVWNRLMELTRTVPFGGKQVHDANIVATMLAHGETRLLTFNAGDFRRFGGLIEVVAP